MPNKSPGNHDVSGLIDNGRNEHASDVSFLKLSKSSMPGVRRKRRGPAPELFRSFEFNGLLLFFPWNKEKRGACLSWYFLVLFVLVLYCLVSATLSHSLLIILVSFIFLLLFCSKSWRKMGDLLALSEKLTLFTWNSLTGDASWQYVSAPHYLIRDVDSYESIYSSPLMTVPLTPIYWL